MTTQTTQLLAQEEKLREEAQTINGKKDKVKSADMKAFDEEREAMEKKQKDEAMKIHQKHTAKFEKNLKPFNDRLKEIKEEVENLGEAYRRAEIIETIRDAIDKKDIVL